MSVGIATSGRSAQNRRNQRLRFGSLVSPTSAHQRGFREHTRQAAAKTRDVQDSSITIWNDLGSRYPFYSKFCWKEAFRGAVFDDKPLIEVHREG